MFHKAIGQSGTPFSSFCHRDKHPVSYARKLVKLLGGDPKASSQELREFLEKKNGKDILKNTFVGKMFGDDNVPDPKEAFWFLPVVDDFCSNPFLPQEPVELLKAGRYNKVPFICGFAKDEFDFLSKNFLKKKPAEVARFNDNIIKFTATGWTLGRDADAVLSKTYEEAVDLLLDNYVGKKEVTKDGTDLANYFAMVSDAMISASACEFVNHMQEDNKTPIFMYR